MGLPTQKRQIALLIITISFLASILTFFGKDYLSESIRLRRDNKILTERIESLLKEKEKIKDECAQKTEAFLANRIKELESEKLRGQSIDSLLKVNQRLITQNNKKIKNVK